MSMTSDCWPGLCLEVSAEEFAIEASIGSKIADVTDQRHPKPMEFRSLD